MLRVKLGLDKQTGDEKLIFTRMLVDRVGENATLFATPNPPLATLIGLVEAIESRRIAKESLERQIQTMGVEIRDLFNKLDDGLRLLGNYVETMADGKVERILAAGMQPAGTPGQYVGPMPKIESLNANPGESVGEVCLQWTPILRGLRTYEIELSETADGQSGWAFHKSETTSRTTVTGLTSGKRYWFRVRAVGTNGPGPVSDAVTRTAP